MWGAFFPLLNGSSGIYMIFHAARFEEISDGFLPPSTRSHLICLIQFLIEVERRVMEYQPLC